MMTTTKEQILGAVRDLVSDFMYYDRKEDEDLPLYAIEDALDAGIVTIDEIVAEFRGQLE